MAAVAENVVANGPWGGHRGRAWSYLPKAPITHISITYEDDGLVNTIRFTSQDESGNSLLSQQFGTHEGSNKAEIDIDPKDEMLRSISGVFGEYKGLHAVKSLFIDTTKSYYGPFGSSTTDGDTYSSTMAENDKIIGFHGRAGWYLDAIGVYLEREPNLSVGPWGAQQPQNRWTYEPKGVISNISITHDDAIYSIRFTSTEENGHVDHSRTFGSKRGSRSDEVAIDIKNEKLNYISGTVGVKSGYVVVTSLSFSTDKKTTFGPFGKPSGTAFSLLVKDEGFVGFHGRSGYWLDAIGVYLKSKYITSLGQWGSQEPGNEWSYVPKGDSYRDEWYSYVPEGVISHISLTHDDAINSIKFTSIDSEDTVHHSKTFGHTTGTNCGEIDIDIKKEKLNNISGTVDLKSGYLVVTSLSFSTNKNTVFGPFGTARGTAFSARVNHGVIIGFYGRSGNWLDAIGVVVNPNNE